MNVEFRESFLKDLRPVKDKNLNAKIKSSIENAERAATPKELSNLKKLKGSVDYFRIKFGDYRIGLKIEKDKVIFVRFLHRREIYRFFP